MNHTTLSIDKSLYHKSAKRAKAAHLSVSTVANLLLKDYAEGRIKIAVIQVEPSPKAKNRRNKPKKIK